MQLRTKSSKSLAQSKGVAAREGLKEAGGKNAGLRTGIAYKAYCQLKPTGEGGAEMGSKQYDLSKFTVLEAHKRAKANGGNAGGDGVGFKEYEADYKNRLYKLWNRMISGSYFPKTVKAVGYTEEERRRTYIGYSCD